MSSIFDTSAIVKFKRKNTFDLSRENCFTCDVGQLIPVVCEPLVPGDIVRISPSAIVKTAPMLAPVYGALEFDFHAFVVPLRLLWKDFSDWIFDNESTLVPPHVRLEYLIAEGFRTTNDYLGLGQNKNIHSDRELNVFKFLGYFQIWKEYFRDEDLQDYPDFLDDNTISDYNSYYQAFHDFWTKPLLRCWRKDYFTSARPWAQKGTPPLLSVFDDNAKAPLTYNGKYDIPGAVGDNANILFPSISLPYTHATDVPADMGFFAGVGTDSSNLGDPYASAHYGTTLRPGQAANWFVDLAANSQGVSVEMLRALFAMQRFQELEAVAGSRYIEGTLAFWGERVKDSRAQVPEFIGMCSQYIHVDEVVQNSETDVTVQGHRTGQGSTAFVGKTFKYYSTEYGLLYVLASIRPKATYFNAIPRFWRQLDQFDFPFPIFQHLGEQEILQSELDIASASSDDDLEHTFGYQSRYAEYRSARDEVHGDFCGSLDFWHFARKLAQPQLDENFVTIQPNVQSQFNRIFAVTGENTNHFWIESYFHFKVKRRLKFHSVPTLIG